MHKSDDDPRRRVVGRMRGGDWVAFLVLVAAICAFTGALAWESTRELTGPMPRDFRAVAHWFDPVFFQYNLIMVLFAVLIVPCVVLSYLQTMIGRKEFRLYHEIPEDRQGEIRERLLSRASFSAYLGSVSMTTLVVLLGASILLIFQPAFPGLRGVDFNRGANLLLMGPFIELVHRNPDAYYVHLINSLTAFQFGFLGAYIYFIGSLARAYFTLDLTPQTFVDGTIRMISASVLALVLSFLPLFHGGVNPSSAPASVESSTRSGEAEGRASIAARAEKPDAVPTPSGSDGTVLKDGKTPGPTESGNLSYLPIVSFFFGFFPKWALLALQRAARTAVGYISTESYRALPLSMLAGMSYSHELRLEREGFDNIENFSSADPVSLAVRTGFGYPQLAQWVSEAWLVTHLREAYPEFVERSCITSRADLKLFLSGWNPARGDAVEFLTAGIADESARRAMMAKLTALTLLVG
jgi:hypothetical protein